MARRLVIPLANGTRPDIGVVTGELLRHLRSGSDFAAEAMVPIPAAEVSTTEKIVSLFLANNPLMFKELQQLLKRFDGREEELYALLSREYSDAGNERHYAQQDKLFSPGEEPLWSAPAGAASFRQSQLSKLGAAQIAPQDKTVTIDQREMHARCVVMYKKYNPAKANSKEFTEMLRKYTPEVVLEALIERYGPEPSVEEQRSLIRNLFTAPAPPPTSAVPTVGAGSENGPQQSTNAPTPLTAESLLAARSP
jgi:hypothetical protein